MKRFLALVFILSILISVVVHAEEMESIIPDESIWGISADTLKDNYPAEYEQCQVEKDEAWRVSNVEVYSYDMDVYYVFGEEMTAPDGTTYEGLSKIAYILNVSDFDTESDIEACLKTMIEEIKKINGEPDSEKKNSSIWKTEKYKIELGKGKLEKYTGSDVATVGVIFKMGSLPRQTKTPKPTNTPKPEIEKKANNDDTTDFGIWEIKNYVDEFNLPTNEKYIVSDSISGTFSNSATTNSELKVFVFCDPIDKHIRIRLFEYGSYQVKNPYSDSCYYDLVIMDSNNKKEYLGGVMYGTSADVYIDPLTDGLFELNDSSYKANSYASIVNALRLGGVVHFSLVEKENRLNKYQFTIYDATGFNNAYYAVKEKNMVSSGTPDETPYDFVSAFSEGLAYVSYRGKSGFVNTKGELQIPLEYGGGNNFSEGYAIVSQNGKYGYIDRTGELVIPCEYESGSSFSEGLASVKKNGKCGYIDTHGNTVLPFQWDIAKSFKDDLAAVKQGDYWGYINREGKTIIPFQWSRASSFSEYEDGLALVKKGDQENYYTIDKIGNIVSTFDHDPSSPLYNHELLQQEYQKTGLRNVKRGSKFGYADAKGNIVIPCQWDFADSGFVDGYARVGINDEAHKYTDDYGRTIVPSLYGIIDSTGKQVIPCEYDNAYYSEGYFITLKNGALSITDTKGNKIR